MYRLANSASPSHNLWILFPVEISSYIFLLSIQSDPDINDNSRNALACISSQHVFNLARVCRAWKDIVYASPCFWNFVYVTQRCLENDGEGFDAIIRRTGESKLYMFVSSLRIFLPGVLAPRLKAIEDRIVFFSFDLRAWEQCPFRSLELGRADLELEIRSPHSWEQIPCSITATPSSLRLYTELKLCPNLRFSALREAAFCAQSTFDDLLVFWPRAPCLVKCSVEVYQFNVQPIQIQHARLEDLTISHSGILADQFFPYDLSRLPRLRRLTLQTGLQSYIPGTAPFLVHVSAADCSLALCQALRSSPLLQSFECTGLYLDVSELKRLLQPTPAVFLSTVTRLTWHFDTFGPPRFIAPLLRFVRRLVALPRLDILTLSTIGLYYDLNFRAKRLIRTILMLKKHALQITLNDRPLAEYVA